MLLEHLKLLSGQIEAEATFARLASFRAARRFGVSDSHNARLESFERNYNWMHGLHIQTGPLLSTYQVKVIRFRCE